MPRPVPKTRAWFPRPLSTSQMFAGPLPRGQKHERILPERVSRQSWPFFILLFKNYKTYNFKL